MTPLVIFPFFNTTLFIYFTISFQKRVGIFLETFARAFFLTFFFFFFSPLTFYIINRKFNRHMEIRQGNCQKPYVLIKTQRERLC